MLSCLLHANLLFCLLMNGNPFVLGISFHKLTVSLLGSIWLTELQS